MKTILVTGAGGFIGSHLCQYLDVQRHHVIRADRTLGFDLSLKEDAELLPDVDIVVHLAAFNGTKHFYERPLDVMRDNLLTTQNLIDRYAGKVERFIFSGTCESYAGAVDKFNWPVPTDESVPLVIDDVTNPRWSYGGSKIANELQVIAAQCQLNQDYTIIRYHNVYGPNQKDHFIQEFYARAKTGDLTLNGWQNTRSFMYISDAVEITSNIIFSSSCRNQILNVGGEEELSIKSLAETILELSNIKGELILKDAPVGSVSRRCPDITKLKRLVEYSPRVSLKEGLRRTLETL